MAGGVSRRSGKASSVTASPCQLPQRGSQGRFAPFLPPAFMRGEGHAVAGGVPRSGGESLLSHGIRRDRLPADNPVAALTCHLSCHSLPRLRFAYPQRESQERFAPILRQHRTIRQEVSGRIFAPIQSLENEGILYVFETVKKGLCPFLTKGLQSAARTSCPLTADKTHTCSLSCIFCQVHAPTENDQNPFAACGRQTLRGFFDTLRSGRLSAARFYWVFV